MAAGKEDAMAAGFRRRYDGDLDDGNLLDAGTTGCNYRDRLQPAGCRRGRGRQDGRAGREDYKENNR